MSRSRARVVTLALLAALLAAQVHLCLDATVSRLPAHSCQVCVSGAWAIVSPGPELSAGLESKLLDKPQLASPADFETADTRASRAPPSA